MGIKGKLDGKGSKICVLFGIFSPKRREKGSHLMYEGMLCAEEVLVLCCCRKHTQAQRWMFKAADPA